MNKYLQLLNGIFLIASLSGCAQMTLERGDTSTPGPKQEYVSDSFLFGLIHHTELPSEALACPEGEIHSVELRMSTSDVLLTLVTLGVYVPHRATIVCGSKT